MKFETFNFKKVTSTNDAAISLIRNDKKKSGYVFAKKQTKGRGTFGKHWVSKEGNLFITIFFQLKKNYPPFNEFSIINPIIVSSVIGDFCGKKNVSIKWPNDVFVKGKKICGILQELITSNSEKFLIIGIGMNIISNPNIKNKYKATNILFETKKKLSIYKLTKQIIESYENFFGNLNSYNYSNFKKKAESMASNYNLS